MEPRYIVGIEIGSSKIKGAVGHVDASGALTVHAVEEQPLIECVRYGVVHNVEIVANTVADILHRLEQRLAPRKVEGVYVSIGGLSLCSTRIEVQRQLTEEMEITRALTASLKEQGRKTDLPDRDVVGYAPLSYLIDGKSSEHPEGTYGTNIRLLLNLISCRTKLKCNLKRVIADKLGLTIHNYVIHPTAEADLVLTSEEKRSGCMFVDFGAETTTVCVYKKGSLQYLATLPLGSRNITKDITGLVHLEEHAERLKRNHGTAAPSALMSHQSIDGVDANEFNACVSARTGEIIANMIEQVKYAGYKPAELPAGIVVVGGGTRLRDFITRLETESKMKVRVGTPSQNIRVADGRLQPADAVDVISVLFAAVPEAEECMPMPAPPIPDPIEDQVAQPEPDVDRIQPQPAPAPAPVPERKEPAPAPPKPRSRNFFSRIADTVTRIMSDEDDMDEDPE